MSFVRRSLVVLAVLSLLALPVLADHSWGNYHWARSSNPIALQLGDNVDSRWDTFLDVAAADWNSSSVLNVGVISGSTNTRRCSPDNGKIEVCNDRYGRNGWLGIAGIWASGSHITRAYTKLNDTYFDTATYNKPEWRAFVTCQEVGHDFGLDHQDENFDNPNLGSCMDYTSNPGTNQHPNSHDYAQLETMYSHADASGASLPFDSMATSMMRPPTVGEILAGAGQWGAPIRYDAHGRPNLFELVIGRTANGELERVFTHVLWAPIAIEEIPEMPEERRLGN
ncbi:MAG: hypothetical protein ACRD2J_09330 [Thermoanaerobaculia bacterium]